jgi:hypothetical protein
MGLDDCLGGPLGRLPVSGLNCIFRCVRPRFSLTGRPISGHFSLTARAVPPAVASMRSVYISQWVALGWRFEFEFS